MPDEVLAPEQDLPAAGIAEQVGPDPAIIARGLKKLGRVRLADECADRIEEEVDWENMKVGELTAYAMERLPLADQLSLAAEGKSTPGAPPLRGFIWGFKGALDERPKLLGTLIEKLSGTDLADGLELLSLEEIPQPVGTGSYLLNAHIVEHDWAPVGGTLEPVEAHRRAFVSIDPDDRILTVFAGAAEIADALGAEIRNALSWQLTPVRLGNVTQPTKLPENAGHLAPQTLWMLELVYGRFATRFELGNPSRAWTRPVQDPDNPDDTASRKKLENVLYTPDVIRLLTRGDHLYGLSFEMRRPPDDGMKRRGALDLSVTLKDDDVNGLVLTVGGASSDRGRGLPLYDDLRRLVLRSDPSDGVHVSAVVDRIFKDYVPKT